MIHIAKRECLLWLAFLALLFERLSAAPSILGNYSRDSVLNSLRPVCLLTRVKFAINVCHILPQSLYLRYLNRHI